MSSPEAPLDQPGHTPQKSRRVQLAAVVALVAAVGIAWIALSMVANDPIGLIFAFGAIFLLVYCGSFLVIRRGPRRFLVLPPALTRWCGSRELLGWTLDRRLGARDPVTTEFTTPNSRLLAACCTQTGG